MAVKLETATDRSTYVVTASFADEDGASVTPLAASWSLYNDRSAVVNGRDGVAISPLAPVVDIVLSGDDLDPADGEVRYLTISATYNSDLGNNLPLRGTAIIPIESIAG